MNREPKCKTCGDKKTVLVVGNLYCQDFDAPCPSCIGWTADTHSAGTSTEHKAAKRVETFGIQCLLCGRQNAEPMAWYNSSSICPACEDRPFQILVDLDWAPITRDEVADREDLEDQCQDLRDMIGAIEYGGNTGTRESAPAALARLNGELNAILARLQD